MFRGSRLGRYELFEEIARGGTAVVHLGRIAGAAGFTKVVAIKRVFPMLSGDPEFVAMFRDEVRLATRVRHANVIAPLDVDTQRDDLFLVMDYVHGDSLSRLLRLAVEKHEPVPTRIALRIIIDVLEGLHAAHTAKDESGNPLGIVHRDVSPHNVLVGVDGTARVVDFGIAKAAVRASTTREGHLKGKLGYMAAEQLSGEEEDARTDVYGASVVLWEMLTGERLFMSTNEGNLLARVLEGVVTPPDRIRKDLSPALSDLVMKGLSRDPALRPASAREMAVALENIVPPAAAREVGEWVTHLGGEALAKRRTRIDEIERGESEGSTEETNSPGAAERTLTAHTPTSPDPASAPLESAPSAVRPRLLWGSFALFVSLVLGVGFVRFLAARPSAPAPPPPASATISLDAAVEAAVLIAPTPSVAPSASASAAPSASHAAPVRPPPRKSTDCSTPTFIDARGIRRIKPGCL